MVDRQQPQQPWRPFQPNAPQPPAPWTASRRPGIPNQPPGGPPVAMNSTGMHPVAPLRPGVPSQPPSFGMQSPFRPHGSPMTNTTPPHVHSMGGAMSSPRAVQYSMPGPPSTGGFPGVRPPGHAQPMFRPPAASTPGTLPPPSYGIAPPHAHGGAPPPTVPIQSQSWGGGNEVLDKFESLTLGPSAPGVHDNVDDGRSLPRPSGVIPDPPIQMYPQNAHHSFLRMTTVYAPRSGSLRERFQFPYGAIVQPLAETPETPPIPVVKLAAFGILRCRRCRTYINPFVSWVDGGRRWQCNICCCLNDTPRDFFCSLNNDGSRRDAESRPELSCGSVEYVAPPEYMVRPPMPAVYLFVVDVSCAQTSAEVLTSLAAAVRASLDKLQGDDRKKIGFLTFDRTLQFYNLKSSDSAKMFVVPEIEDPFLPQPDDLLVNVEEARSKIEAFLDSWPANFSSATHQSQQSAMGAALQAAFMILNHTGGKLELFLCAPPSLGSGAIRNRDNVALYNTDRETSLRNPEDSFFKRFAAECSRVHICVDVFSFCRQYTDLASIACLPKYTGGQVYRYPGFLAKRDGGRLRHDVVRNLTRYTAWEGVMRLRCSKGLKITSFCGHFFVRSTDLLALPTTDPDKAYAVEINHDEMVLDGAEACLQCALLYTSSCGERRIRVHTLQFPVSHELSDLYRGADAAAMVAHMAKLGADLSYSTKLSSVQKTIEGKLISGLREYRVFHSRHFRGVNKLIYPETLKWMPLWVLGLLKSNFVRGTGADVAADDRIACSFDLMASTIDKIIHLLCPTMYDVTNIETWEKKEMGLPPVVPCSYDYLMQSAVYVLDTSQLIFLLFGSAVPLEFLSKLTGATPQALKTQPLHSSRVEPPQKNALSQKLCEFLDDIRTRRKGYQPVILLQLGTEQEQHLWSFLIEDKKHSMRSYLDFVLMLHRQIGGK